MKIYFATKMDNMDLGKCLINAGVTKRLISYFYAQVHSPGQIKYYSKTGKYKKQEQLK